jgi:hypothetical protein
MARLVALLVVAVLAVAASAVAAAAGPVFPIYEIPTQDLPDLCDGTLADWEAAVPGPSLTHDDFAPLAVQDGAPVDPGDLAYRVYLGWHSNTQTLWIGVERVDDVYVNTYPGGEPQNVWMHDGMDFMVDGDHSGGDYSGFDSDFYGGEEMAKLLTGYQAQQYTMIPESPDGVYVTSNTSASGWVAALPWADGGGAAWGVAPTTSVMEDYVTPWDALDWHGPDVSTRSTLSAGRTIGFQVSMPDWDVVGTYHAFHTICGLCCTWRMADQFVDGELIGCDRFGCQSQPPYLIDNVDADSWGRIKAALQ